MPDNFSSAAEELVAEGYVQFKDTAAYAVSEAIRLNDPAKVWSLVDYLATCEQADYQKYRGMIFAQFGKRVKIGELDKLVRLRLAPSVRGESIDMAQKQVYQIADESMERIRAKMRDKPELFVRGGTMVDIVVNENGSAGIREVNADILIARMDRSARFVRGAQGVTSPKKEVAIHVLAGVPSAWRLPTLRSVVQSPVLRSDGSILSAPGYDEPSGIYHVPHSSMLDMEPVPEQPCNDEVQEAIAVIDDIIGDFPFVDESSRANFIGLLLTAVVRPAYEGCTPLAIIDAPTQGTGKSLLAEVFCLISTGASAAMTPYPPDDTELGKVVATFMREGAPIIVFDNISSSLRSNTLAMILTSDRFKGRLLSTSISIDAPQRAVWLATGNNVRLGEELRRRCYQIRVDSQSSKPYSGRKFRHANLKGHIMSNRAHIIRALLTIARAWFSAGCPPMPAHKPLGSFENWDHTISSILHFAGVAGFLDNLEEFQEAADDESETWESFLAKIDVDYTGDSFSVRELCTRMSDNNWKEYLPDYLQLADKKGSLAYSLGNAFRSRAKKRFGVRELYLDKCTIGASRNVGRWKVAVGRPESHTETV